MADVGQTNSLCRLDSIWDNKAMNMQVFLSQLGAMDLMIVPYKFILSKFTAELL